VFDSFPWWKCLCWKWHCKHFWLLCLGANFITIIFMCHKCKLLYSIFTLSVISITNDLLRLVETCDGNDWEIIFEALLEIWHKIVDFVYHGILHIINTHYPLLNINNFIGNDALKYFVHKWYLHWFLHHIFSHISSLTRYWCVLKLYKTCEIGQCSGNDTICLWDSLSVLFWECHIYIA